MKISLVAEHTDPLSARHGSPHDGDSGYIASLARNLARLGHRVCVHVRGDGAKPPERTRMGRGVTVAPLPAQPQDLPAEQRPADGGAFGRGLAEALREARPDVVHCLGWASGLAAVGALRELESEQAPPLVQEFTALGGTERRAGLPADPGRERVEAALAGTAQAVKVSAADQAAELSRRGLARSRIHVIPHGVDTDRFSPAGSAMDLWQYRPGEYTRLVAAGGFGPGGGAGTLVDAVAAASRTELLLLDLSSPRETPLGEDAHRLSRLVKERRLAGRVQIRGGVDGKDLARLLRSADAYVSARRHPGDGDGALLAAMACGLPVVAAPVGTAADAVLDGVSGILVPDPEPASVHGALQRLAASATTRTAYGIAAADRARCRFTWPRIAEETIRMYAATARPRERVPAAALDAP